MALLVYALDKEVRKEEASGLGEKKKRDKRQHRTIPNVPSILHRVLKEKEPLGGSI